MNNFFFDTEFSETWGMRGDHAVPTIELISIGIISESGRTLYVESSEFSAERCNNWVKVNVLPRLGPPGDRLTREEIKQSVLAFLGDEPVLWAYYASYDWVAFCWLFGLMIDLPKGYPMHPMDLQQLYVHLGKPQGVKPPKSTNEHNALEDARWNLQLYNNLMDLRADVLGVKSLVKGTEK